LYTYYFTLEEHADDDEHPRFHPTERCLLGAKLMGYDMERFRRTTSGFDEDRCKTCGGLLRVNKKGKQVAHVGMVV
jgi:hypothetical protein